MTSVEVKNLTKEFHIRNGMKRSTLTAVDRVSFDLLPGRTVALVGESGSGKSTIARMLARLEKPTSGSIDVTLDDRTPVHGSVVAHTRAPTWARSATNCTWLGSYSPSPAGVR